MNKIILATLIVTMLSACFPGRESSNNEPLKINPQFAEKEVNASIRALEVIDESRVWFAGSGGIFGCTKDGGKTWTIDSIKIADTPLEFRAIACTDEAVLLLNVASPAYLLKSTDEGKNWEAVYQEDQPKVFYNSMKFSDNQHGIAVGDPIERCLSVIITNDGGNTWNKLDCSNLPPTVEGEAGFAASNTNIAVSGKHVWLASGGQNARVFRSDDRGASWEVSDTPMQQGGKMTGIFSIEFHDENQGIIFGGNWEDQENNRGNKAVTTDGGRTWQLLNEGVDPGYRSCVQYVPRTKGQQLFAIGIPGISFSPDQGKTWQHFNKTYFYTIRLSPSGKVGWLAGRNKIAKMTW